MTRDEADNAPDEKLFRALASLPAPTPPPDLHHRFKSRVSAYRRRRRIAIAGALSAAAAVAVVVGIAWRHQPSRMRFQSPGDRLAAVLQAAQMPANDDRAIRALTEALLHDSNTNVRVAAAEALGRMATADVLRDAVERAITAPRSPFIDAALISATDRLPEPHRTRLLRSLNSSTALQPIRNDTHRGAM